MLFVRPNPSDQPRMGVPVLRLRIPELLKARDLTPYALAKASGGRISMSTAHRLMQLRGRLQMFNGIVLEALCDVLKVEPGELLERTRETKRARRP